MSTDNSTTEHPNSNDLSIQMHQNPSAEKYIYHFYVIYNREGIEMISLRRNFVEDQKVILSNMVLNYPGFTVRTIEIDYRKYAEERYR